MPQGVFLPYAWVKTDIIFWKNEPQIQDYDIEFIDIKNDWYSLDANRRPRTSSDLEDYFGDKQKLINNEQVWVVNSSQIYDKTKLNDLEIAKAKIDYEEKDLINKINIIKKQIKVISSNEEKQLKEERLVELQNDVKEKVIFSKKLTDTLKSFDLNLVISRYKNIIWINKNIITRPLWQIVDIKTGKKDVNQWNPDGEYPFFTCAKEVSFSDTFSFDTEALLIAWNWDVWDIKYYKWKFEAYQRTYILDNFNDIILPKYLYFCLKYKLKEVAIAEKQWSTMPYIKLSTLQNFEIPLPSIEYQHQIIKEIEISQKIINGAKQVLKIHKPRFDINEKWNNIKLSEISNPEYWVGLEAQDEWLFRYIRITDILEDQTLKSSDKKFIDLNDDNSKKYLLKEWDILIARTWATYWKTLYFESKDPSVFAWYLIRLNLDESKILSKYYRFFTFSDVYEKQKLELVSGWGQPQFNANAIKNLQIPLPSISEQEKIITELEEEQKLVDANKKIIEIFEQKIKAKIDQIWSWE